MRWKLTAAVALAALGLTTAALAVEGRGETPGAPTVTYAYRVERARGTKELKDLEQRLNDAGRTGWRVSKAVGPSFNDELVVVLEKSESPR
jgi:hypothetical protein